VKPVETCSHLCAWHRLARGTLAVAGDYQYCLSGCARDGIQPELCTMTNYCTKINQWHAQARSFCCPSLCPADRRKSFDFSILSQYLESGMGLAGS
jgi:hypothetical protein